MITINRFILLDPILLFFISGAIYTSAKFHNLRDQAFSMSWWAWLSAVGVMLAGAVSVKFVGFFIVAFVGLRAISDLWHILGDLSRPVSYTVKHLLARALCLIVLPIVLYMAIFFVHLRLLIYTGTGDEFYSSTYQSDIIGNPLYNTTFPRGIDRVF